MQGNWLHWDHKIENRIEKAPLVDAKEIAKRSRGSFGFCLERNGMVLVTWNDKTVVSLVSTVDPIQLVTKVKKKKKTG